MAAVTYPRRLNRAGGWENIRTLLHDDDAAAHDYDNADDADGQEDTEDGVVVDDNIEDPDDNDEFLKGFCHN